MMTAIGAIVAFLLLITIHELGHFMAAKATGIRVFEFAVGMGPVICKWDGKEDKTGNITKYSIRLLPIGGYCQMGEDEESDEADSYGNKPIWARFVTLFAGAFMNLVLGFIIFLILTVGGQSVTTTFVGSFSPNSPAQAAGMQVGDKIVKINGNSVVSYPDAKFEITRTEKDTPVEVTVKRGKEKVNISVNHIFDKEQNAYIIGFSPKNEPLNFGRRIETAFSQTVFMSKLVIKSLFDLVTGKVSVNMLSGPVGIVGEIGNAVKRGFSDFMFLLGLITVNLGIFNLLPLPALDGGRIFFLAIEAVRRKKIPADKEAIVHMIGFGLLILLMLYATSNDIIKLFTK